ncbi:MAG: hypothetical protein MUF53_10600 [Gemmatimonadaceae bacterium]|nr:hypothetical protein [Gemmatimonadaceae bacterium]
MYECPWKNDRRRSSATKPAKSVSVATVAPSGRKPPVIPFERAIRSGVMPARSQANSGPVRPKPVNTSSAMSSVRPAVRARIPRSTSAS